MMNSSDKRKNFRFPAFDDEIGVKLQTGKKRSLFQDEVAPSIVEMDPYQETVEPIYEDTYRSNSRKKTVVTEQMNGKENKRAVNKPVLNRQWSQPKPKADLFSSHHKREELRQGQMTRTVPTHQDNGDRKKQELERKLPEKYQTRAYFKPKHIPASVISDEGSEPRFNNRDVVKALQESKNDYLLMDHNHESVFQTKQSEMDPTVRRFNPRDERPIPVTRRQLKQINKDASTLTEEELDKMLPKTRREIQEAKLSAKNATAYAKKQEQEKEVPVKKKNTRLEKSLSGIMEEESPQDKTNRYFD